MNEIVNQRECSKPMEVEAIVLDDKSYDSTIDEQRMGSLCDEIIAIIKDDRTNTKKAINSDSNSRSMALKQNDILMKCYESEFRREDTTDEQRASLLKLVRRSLSKCWRWVISPLLPFEIASLNSLANLCAFASPPSASDIIFSMRSRTTATQASTIDARYAPD